MGQRGCGQEHAEQIWQQVLQNVEGHIPADIEIYGRCFVRIFCDIPIDYADYCCSEILKSKSFPPRGDLIAMAQDSADFAPAFLTQSPQKSN